MRNIVSVMAVLALVGAAQAQVVDGVLTPADGYGAPIFTQSVQTQFGPAPGGSEIAAVYCKSDATNLTLFFAGSLETNFNKLQVWIDSRSGGQNTISGTNNPTNDGWRDKYAGFTFDQGFEPDFLTTFRRGTADLADRFDVDFAEIGTNNGGRLGNPFTHTPNNATLNLPIAGITPFSATLGYTSSTTTIGGGTGAVNPADALAAIGGVEFRIPLAALGLSAGQTFLLSAHITNGDNNYLSNQFVGGLNVGQGNLGSDGTGAFFAEGPGPRGVNLNNFAGNQYILVPAPGALAFLGLGGLVVSRRRRA